MHVAFDIGQVLCHCDMDKYINEICDKKVNDHGFPSVYFPGYKNTVLRTLESIEKFDYLGMINRNFYLEKMCNINTNGLNEVWNSIVYPNDMMMNFLVKLKDAGVKIGLLSNMGPDHAKYLREEYPELFHKTIQHLSFEVGAFKPTKLFYQSFLMSNEDFAGCVYLDDVKENIVMGTKMGFDSIHFDLRDFKKPSELKKRLNILYDKITTGI